MSSPISALRIRKASDGLPCRYVMSLLEEMVDDELMQCATHLRVEHRLSKLNVYASTTTSTTKDVVAHANKSAKERAVAAATAMVVWRQNM